MALSRKMLKAMGIEDEKIEQIIEEHGETVTALKQERDGYKADAEKAQALESEVKALKAKGEDGFEDKYNAEHEAFEAYKAKVEGEKAEAEKRGLYRKLIADAGVDQKRIDAVLKVSDLSEVEVKDGAIVDADKLTEGIKADFGDFIPVITKSGADVKHPPAGGDAASSPKNLRDALHERYEAKE